MLEIIGGLTPSVGVAFLFWLAIRAIISADRRERAAEAQFERESRAKVTETAAGRPAGGAASSDGASAGGTPNTL